MKKYRCSVCGYIYDEEKEKVRFCDLPDDWTCPVCGVSKDLFEEIIDDTELASDDLMNLKINEAFN